MLKQQTFKEDCPVLYGTHSKHIVDPRETTDWSQQGKLQLLKQHTKGDGLTIIISGLGYIDVDINDGTFARMVDDTIKYIQNLSEFYECFDYLDFYSLIWLRPHRNEWPITMEQDSKETVFYMNEIRKTYCDFYWPIIKNYPKGKVWILSLNITPASRTFNMDFSLIDEGQYYWAHEEPNHFEFNIHKGVGEDEYRNYVWGSELSLYSNLKSLTNEKLLNQILKKIN